MASPAHDRELDYAHQAARALQKCLQGAADLFRQRHKETWPADVPIEYSVRQDEQGDVTVKIESRVALDPESKRRGRGRG